MRVLAISVDPPEESARMKRELKLPFPLLSDADEAVIRRYGLVHAHANPDTNGDIARPAVLLLDRQGIIRWAMFTEDFRVRVRPQRLLEAARRL